MNEMIVLTWIGGAVFAVVVFVDPRAAEWLASVCWARAQAVKAARIAYAAARRYRMDGRTVVSLPRCVADDQRARDAAESGAY